MRRRARQALLALTRAEQAKDDDRIAPVVPLRASSIGVVQDHLHDCKLVFSSKEARASLFTMVSGTCTAHQQVFITKHLRSVLGLAGDDGDDHSSASASEAEHQVLLTLLVSNCLTKSTIRTRCNISWRGNIRY
jgi:hypothetical protein